MSGPRRSSPYPCVVYASKGGISLLDIGTILFIAWALAIVFTLDALVPINNRLAAGTSPHPREEFKRWDTLHRLRIVLLIAAIVCLLTALKV